MGSSFRLGSSCKQAGQQRCSGQKVVPTQRQKPRLCLDGLRMGCLTPPCVSNPPIEAVGVGIDPSWREQNRQASRDFKASPRQACRCCLGRVRRHRPVGHAERKQQRAPEAQASQSGGRRGRRLLRPVVIARVWGRRGLPWRRCTRAAAPLSRQARPQLHSPVTAGGALPRDRQNQEPVWQGGTWRQWRQAQSTEASAGRRRPGARAGAARAGRHGEARGGGPAGRAEARAGAGGGAARRSGTARAPGAQGLGTWGVSAVAS